MKNTAATLERVQAFVDEALRWLPSEPVNRADAPLFTGSSATDAPRSSVLVAEDNADMRDYIHGLLKESFDVTVVGNGQAALDSIRRFRPDLVLSDVMMPILDGFDLLRAIRSDSTLRDIPVILLSARAREGDRIEGLDTGADDYVTKPFSAPELRARVRANLALGRMRREAVLTMIESDEKLHRVNENLEARILAEVQLHKAMMTRLAQAEKSAALGQLAGGMAHDFNNILQVVSGYGSLIRQKSNDAAAVERMARVIEEAANRGHSVTQRLLVFARQDGLRPEAVDLPALLDGLREVMVHTLGARITLALDFVAGLPLVLVDRNQLEMVMINIAANAGDAMPDGGTLTFSAQAVVMSDTEVEYGLSAGNYLRLSIEDTGGGMDAATLARATEPFFTTKPVGKGTGLGLGMAKSFAERSDGALTIVSASGRGTTVTLLLPSTDVPDGASVAFHHGLNPANGTTMPRILLVDDEMWVRDVISELLGAAGYDVTQVGDAAAALDVLKRGETLDLLVSDLTMPGLDGISLIRAAQTQRANLPAILLTGYAGDAPLLALGGSFSLLRKPVDGPQLIDEVASLLAIAKTTWGDGLPTRSRVGISH